MGSRKYSWREIAKVLKDHGFIPIRQVGSHIRFRYESSVNENDVRNVTVPKHDELSEKTLSGIAK